MATHPLPVPVANDQGGQLDKLEALIAAAQSARHAAARELLFCSRAGVRLLEAIHDLTEVDGVHDLAQDVLQEMRPTAVRPNIWGDA